jgi:hypothetical protein
MQRFKSPEQAQHFLAAHAFIHGHSHDGISYQLTPIARNPVRRIRRLATGDVRSTRDGMCAGERPPSLQRVRQTFNVTMPLPAVNVEKIFDLTFDRHRHGIQSLLQHRIEQPLREVIWGGHTGSIST